MRVVMGSDERTYLTDRLLHDLDRRDCETLLVGPLAGSEEDTWAEVGRDVGEAVAAGRADFGIALCWTGNGVCIAANKVPGIRAALCPDGVTAEDARRSNHANVLTLGLRSTTPALAEEILDAWLAAPTLPDEKVHVDVVRETEDRYYRYGLARH